LAFITDTGPGFEKKVIKALAALTSLAATPAPVE
jgi:hypothetical protein